jgi:hypothetical protein
MDEAHEQIADCGPVQRAIEQRILTVQNRPLQALSTMLLSSGALASRRNSVKGRR